MTVDNEQPTSAEPVADAPAIPNVPLLQRLQADMESYSAADRAIVAAMKAGRQMIVRGTSTRGTLTTDTYSLSGFSAALAAIDKACK